MKPSPTVSPFDPRSWTIASAVTLALIYSTTSGSLWRSPLNLEWVTRVAYLRSALISLGDILAMLLLVSLAARCKPLAVLKLAGLGESIRQPLLWALFLFVPAALISLFAAPVAAGLGVKDLIWPTILGPVSEEIFYRGLAVGVLIRWCGWPLIVACLWPAVFFGAAHAWQGADLESLIGVVAITGLGGLLFGWLYARWNYNLWPPILLHIGLNALWTTFNLGENAIGGWFGNALRLAIVVAAIWLSPRMAPSRSASEAR
ncbi:MAG: CPBP family glutamic-type intramembrane protease [Lysobacterales bacterium]